MESKLVKPADGKLGVLCVGLGAVSTTFIVGTFMCRKGMGLPGGSITQMAKIRVGRGQEKQYKKIGEIVPLADLKDLEIGAWDIFTDTAYESALHAEVLKPHDIEPVKDELQKIVPMTAAFDPNFPEVFEKRNAAYLNKGIGLCKYTGARGKSGASDADAETMAYIRGLFDRAGVIWQIAELGKVDAGGGGTVAMYMANRNITTLDAGVPVLSMHAPFEVVSKLDCYETYKGMRAVYLAEK